MKPTRCVVGAMALACVLGAAVVGAQSGSSSQPTTTPKTSAAGQAGKLTPADSRFVHEAATGGMAEVELGKLAADKASSPDVKQFGQRMVDDHSKANDELKQLASQMWVTLPTDVQPKDKQPLNRLRSLSGASFGRAQMPAMVKDHQHDVAEFRSESQKAPDADM